MNMRFLIEEWLVPCIGGLAVGTFIGFAIVEIIELIDAYLAGFIG